MTWIALFDSETCLFDRSGLDPAPEQPAAASSGDDPLLTRGTLLIETRLPYSERPRTLIRYDRPGDWPCHLSLQIIPGGGLVLVLYQGGEVLHQTVAASDNWRPNVVRLSYCWDAPARYGYVALELADPTNFHLHDVDGPNPWRVGDLRSLFEPGPNRYVSPDVEFMALSDEIEPVGPLPSLAPDCPVATPRGYCPAGGLQRGDTVISSNGDIVPVLHRITRTVPARGSMRPLRIRAPYFGLRRDIVVAPSQALVLSGSDVEYLFGHEAVLAPAASLTGGHSVLPEPSGPTVIYTQLLLPNHQPILVAGATVESLYIGRLHRKSRILATTGLAGLDRHGLPDHGQPGAPVLRPFDARILAERRVA